MSALLRLLILQCLVVVATGMAAESDSQQEAARPVHLDEIVVVASRQSRPLSEVAAQVTVIDADDIDANLVANMDGLFRYAPGIEMERSGTRFGSSGININGVGGNRVLIELDGVPLRDQFAIGAYSYAGQDLVEVDRIKRVEVLHGPASVLYGSDAIGGVVALTSWNPIDLVSRTEGDSYASVRGTWAGENSSESIGALGAWSDQSQGLLVGFTRRNGHELEHAASATNDPQNWNSTDAILRYSFDTSNGNRLGATIAGLKRETDTEVNSLLGYGRRFRNTTSLSGHDTEHGARASLDYEFETLSGVRGRAKVYGSQERTRQISNETRLTSSPPVSLYREFAYRQDHTGATVDFFQQWDSSFGRHRFGYGARFIRSDTSELRDASQTDLESGETSNEVLGETFPVRDFPESRSDEIGIYLHDEINLGRLELIPALRWDRYELKPDADEIFREDNPDTQVVSIEDSRLTPRFGILYHANDSLTVYGQVSEGFRAPPFDDVNIGFDIPLFGYRALPNPDLASETSRGVEFGIRRMTGHSSFNVAVFRTDYDDFIESRALIGVDPSSGDLLFQSRNIDRAMIRGASISWDQGLGAWSEALDQWRLSLSAYWAEGENRVSGQALNSVAPPQGVARLMWQSPDARWDLAFNATLTASKSNGDIDHSDGERFATPGWSIFDVTAGWNPRPELQFRVGLFNLSDKTYWRWLDVANLEASNPMIPLLSRPGRSLSVSARIEF